MDMKLEELGWNFVKEMSDENYLVYKNNIDTIYIDLDKRKLLINCQELTFTTLEAIREIVINNAIY